MKKTLLITFLVFLISCKTQTYNEIEKTAWKNLYELKIEQAYDCFVKLKEIKKTDKNILGLAYTQAILKKENYHNTLTNNISDTSKIYNYGFMVAGFKIYYESNGKDSVNFSFEEFKAFHENGKFKIKKGSTIIEGEYENLKPKGIWKYYDLNGKLIREVDSKTMIN